MADPLAGSSSISQPPDSAGIRLIYASERQALCVQAPGGPPIVYSSVAPPAGSYNADAALAAAANALEENRTEPVSLSPAGICTVFLLKPRAHGKFHREVSMFLDPIV